MKNFEEIYKINVNDKTEKKNGLTYLSWAWAWAEFKKAYPNATYTIKRFENNLPYIHDETGYMVFTEVTADNLTYEMWLPVMDNRNKAIIQATMTDINKSIMRCLTKNLAMFGLGLYIYAGEDLPEDDSQEPKTAPTSPKQERVEEVADAETKTIMSVEEAKEYEFTLKGKNYKVGECSNEQLFWLRDNAQDELKEAVELVLTDKAFKGDIT